MGLWQRVKRAWQCYELYTLDERGRPEKLLLGPAWLCRWRSNSIVGVAILTKCGTPIDDKIDAQQLMLQFLNMMKGMHR